MVYLGQRQAGLGEKIMDGVGRQTGPMFDAAETLLFRSGNDATVTHKACGRIRMKRVEAQNGYHAESR